MDPSKPNTQPETETSSPVQSGQVIAPGEPSQPAAVPPAQNKPKKKKVLIALALILVLAAAVAVWWFMFKDKAEAPSTTTPIVSTPAPAELKPSAAIYTVSTDEPVKPNAECGDSNTKVYSQPISGGDKSEVADLGKNNNVSYSEVQKGSIAFVSDPGCGSTDGTTIWLSKDSGKTYTKPFVGQPIQKDKGWDQITSLKFSSDGKKLVFGFLSSDRTSGNTVKEIDVTTGKTKDLFTLKDSSGVFIQGYDATKGLIYYSKGCYNCDGGNAFGKIYVHDLAKKTDTLVFQDTKLDSGNVIANSDFTKFLLLKATPGQGLGGGPPYYIDELTVANKSAKNLVKITDDYPIWTGYRDGDEMPAYTNKDKIYLLDSNKTVLYDAEKPIQNVALVSRDSVIASSGSNETFVLNQYKFSDKTNTKILTGNSNTRILGITWN